MKQAFPLLVQRPLQLHLHSLQLLAELGYLTAPCSNTGPSKPLLEVRQFPAQLALDPILDLVEPRYRRQPQTVQLDYQKSDST